MHTFYLWIASGFGSGYLPKMPGTWGSLVGLFLSLFLFYGGKNWLLGGTLLATGMGWYCSHRIMMSYPPDHPDTDPSFIVIDEIAGLFLTIYLMWIGMEYIGKVSSQYFLTITWWQEGIFLGLCFITFRFFDIVKPFPISWIDHHFSLTRSHQALGIMLDDLVAGLFAALLTIFILVIL